MHETIASRTAYRVAIRRAEHQILDDPRVLDDPLAVRIIGSEAAAKIQPGVVTRTQRLSPSFRAFMAVRSRYAEDQLAKAYEAGVRQCVILGAGLDTFAYRNPYPDLRVFEVDHPATQAWKRERLIEGKIEIPSSLTFVPADFERHSLEDELNASVFQLEQPGFFSWLGVTPYLTERAFEQTMTFVASCAPKSAIALDYAVPRESLNFMERIALDALSARVERVGEPFQLFLDPAKLQSRLIRMGFRSCEDLGRDKMNALYFAHRSDGLRVKGNLGHLICAHV